MKKRLLFLCPFLFSVFVLSGQRPELVIQREGHVDEATLVRFSPDDRQALSAGQDHRIILWDLGSGKFVRYIEADTLPLFVDFGPGSGEAVALLADNSLQAWNLSTGEKRWKQRTAAFSQWIRKGDELLLLQQDKTIASWDLATGQQRWKKQVRGKDPLAEYRQAPYPPNLAAKLAEMEASGINAVEVSGDGRTAVVALGLPTMLTMITPGAPAGRSGYGELVVWDMQLDRLKYAGIALPEKAAAIDLSSDGRYCLSASSDRTIRLWDLDSGRELRRMERTPSMETRFAFAPDFSRLALSRFDGAFKTWSLDQRAPFVSSPNGMDANTFLFTPRGNELLTADRRGTILRLEGSSLDSALQFTEDPHLEVIQGLTLSPDGKKLLAGSAKESRVMFVNVSTIPKKAVKRVILNAKKDTIGVQTDAGLLYGRFGEGYFNMEDTSTLGYLPNVHSISLWDVKKGTLDRIFYPYDRERSGWMNQRQDLCISDDSRFALAKVDGTWLAWDMATGDPLPNAETQQRFDAFFFDERGGHALTMDPDGTLSLRDMHTGAVEQTYSGLGQPVAVALDKHGARGLALSSDGMLREWALNTGAVIRQIPVGSFSKAPELIFTPQEDLVLLRDEVSASIWDMRSGKVMLQVGNSRAASYSGDLFWDKHAGEHLSLFQFLPDGRRAVSATYDGTLRFWDFHTGEEICTVLFPGGDAWAITTPEGLFDASEGAMQQMYFRLGTEVLELEQLKERYFEPGLLQKLLGFAQGGLRPVDALDEIALYPQIADAGIEDARLTVSLRERSGSIGRVALLLNEKIELDPNVNPEFKTRFTVDLSRFEGYFFRDSVNSLTLRAYNREGWLKGPPYRLEYKPTIGEKGLSGSGGLISLRSGSDARLDSINLYALLIGTSNFRGSQLNLKYPDKDAEAFARAIRLVGTPLFGKNMDIKVLTTSAEPWPRKTEIQKAFAEIAAKSDPNDILLVYFSGHGITYPPNSEKGQFYYLTTDILGDKLDDPVTLNAQAISQDTLQEWIRKVKALKRILILDACNSGSVVQGFAPGAKSLNSDQRRALERMNDRSGMFVLAGSAADKSSFEASRYGHGLLTYSLLNNIPLVAASNRSFIDVNKLFHYALEEVPRLAADIGKAQKPELIGAESFDIGILDQETAFPAPQPLPVFIRTVFIDSQRNRDLEGLTRHMNHYLEQLASGKQPALAFWDVETFHGDHYFIGGQYKVAGGAIEGNGTLFHKEEVLGDFSFSGSTGAIEALAEEIMEKIFEILENQSR